MLFLFPAKAPCWSSFSLDAETKDFAHERKKSTEVDCRQRACGFVEKRYGHAGTVHCMLLIGGCTSTISDFRFPQLAPDGRWSDR